MHLSFQHREAMILSLGCFSAYGSQLKEDLRKNTYRNRVLCNMILCIHMQFETIYKYSSIRLPFNDGRAQILDIF